MMPSTTATPDSDSYFFPRFHDSRQRVRIDFPTRGPGIESAKSLPVNIRQYRTNGSLTYLRSE